MNGLLVVTRCLTGGSSSTRTLFQKRPRCYGMPLKHITPTNFTGHTSAVLHTLFPSSLVVAAVAPKHLTAAVPKIIEELSFVDIPRTPLKSPIATFSVVLIVTFIGISVLSSFCPDALTMSQTTLKLPFEYTSVVPPVLSIAIRLSTLIGSFVAVAISKPLQPLPVFQELLELSFVFIAINPYVNAIAVSFVIFPLADVPVSFRAFPHPAPVNNSVLKLANIYLLVGVRECPISVWFAIHKIAHVDGTGRELVIASSHLEVQAEFAFIDSCSSDQQTKSVFHAISKPAHIDEVLASHHGEVLLLPQLILGKEILVEAICVEVVIQIVNGLSVFQQYLVFLCYHGLGELVDLYKVVFDRFLRNIYVGHLLHISYCELMKTNSLKLLTFSKSFDRWASEQSQAKRRLQRLRNKPYSTIPPIITIRCLLQCETCVFVLDDDTERPLLPILRLGADRSPRVKPEPATA